MVKSEDFENNTQVDFGRFLAILEHRHNSKARIA